MVLKGVAGALRASGMTKHLTQADWLRIADALRHFSHHPDYKETLDKVIEILGEP